MSECESDMAEGIEEAESNSGSSGTGDTTTNMLGAAAMPCEIINPSIGTLKREFDAYKNKITTISKSTTSSPSTTPIPHTKEEQQRHSDHEDDDNSNDHPILDKRHSHRSSIHEQEEDEPQEQPINLKSEVSNPFCFLSERFKYWH